ncbi:type II toxin-antitoxin system HigB family toxin [Mucilaginibacter sp. cycad4]|uniref:type II toxin-antitoxin system HigB family toxin n=1 Tax=Mucilaginibacter sp. cycad4 TaxID=3342096 RepID=UPI002AAA9477|nr:type II toxin-antitoxin system HigB family toxin [Mucilaginibacter gossypii]WPU98171.1 type II toxin-antitoxin system HigB family toxin [Mucilaginibacter gossypii]
MNIITRRTILYYINEYPLAANSLKNWYEEISKSDFSSFNELKNVYGNASIIANNRVIFNIKGNSFRLIVSFNFEVQTLYVIWFGTHKEYDKVDAANVRYFKGPGKL